MKTIEIKLYSFNELSEEAKQVAIENLQKSENYLNYEWYDSIYDEYTEKIEAAGFDVTRIYFSGFWSQGDGAMFEYERLNDNLKNEFIESLSLSPMRKEWLKNNIYISGKGNQKGMYYHENSCDHSIYWEVDNGDLHYTTTFYKWLESFNDDFETFVENKYKDLCRELYAALEKEYYDLLSDESVKDYLQQDDEEIFTEHGERY